MSVESSTGATQSIDRERVKALTEQEMNSYKERTGTSSEYFQRATRVMPNGVPSSFQATDPWPVYIERGEGSRVWDVDGAEYVDFHNGFGVMCIGHANPIVGAAVKARVDRAPTSPPRPGARSPSPRSWPSASTFPSGASATPGRSRRCRRSTSPAGPPVAT